MSPGVTMSLKESTEYGSTRREIFVPNLDCQPQKGCRVRERKAIVSITRHAVVPAFVNFEGKSDEDETVFDFLIKISNSEFSTA